MKANLKKQSFKNFNLVQLTDYFVDERQMPRHSAYRLARLIQLFTRVKGRKRLK